ncbi:MAG: UDP-N-acetylmuramoyl-L-alanine--D-glutamate ligase [Nitrospinae bacterium]|nr:UDP-N-acetylmuramoyl-L-alanine--D-glutamate ligase [Nitrospinota bacterium]
MTFKNKQISIIGMARTGIAAANYLAEQGARVTLMDGKPKESLTGVLKQLNSRVNTVFQSSAPLPDADLVVLSPGVDIHSPDLKAARKSGTEIISELELAYRVSGTPIIAVTGTNGKSTTTSLIGHLLEQGGKDVRIGGNIGVPFISQVQDAPRDYRVLEVSSFQLEGTVEFHPEISVILNITPDHLDRHKTIEHYAALKEKIAVNQTRDDVLVLNHDDPWVHRIAAGKPSQKWHFSMSGPVARGCYLKKDRVLFTDGEREETICHIGDLNQAMQYQVENILPAALVARLAGIDTAVIAKALPAFKGLEHRMEWVRSINGIDFINDSKGTNIGALEKSLNSFDQPIVLIAGGQDKGGDFQSLKSLFKQKVKHMVLIGEAKSKIQAVLNGSFGYESVDDMEAAVRGAYAHAQPGDVVLLSPACASFDMFRDYEDRGRQFKGYVQSL